MKALPLILAVALAATPAATFTRCAGGLATVEGPDAAAEARICRVVERAVPELAACGLEVPANPRITLHDRLVPGCLGAYHCGDGRIDLLTRARFDDAVSNAGAFAAVDPDAHYDSVVVHELTHAALGEMPCPFEACIVTQEYLAFAMQVRSLPETERRRFEAASKVDWPVSTRDFGSMLLWMAPQLFSDAVWQHFSGRPDPCGYARALATGEILLDRERL